MIQYWKYMEIATTIWTNIQTQTIKHCSILPIAFDLARLSIALTNNCRIFDRLSIFDPFSARKPYVSPSSSLSQQWRHSNSWAFLQSDYQQTLQTLTNIDTNIIFTWTEILLYMPSVKSYMCKTNIDKDNHGSGTVVIFIRFSSLD